MKIYLDKRIETSGPDVGRRAPDGVMRTDGYLTFIKPFEWLSFRNKEKPIILAKTMTPEIKEYPVPQIAKEDIKDTCGAGDALMGGFLAMYIDGRDLDFCMKCGIYCASQSLKQNGSTLPKEMHFKA